MFYITGDYIITHCAGGRLQREVFEKNYPDCKLTRAGRSPHMKRF